MLHLHRSKEKLEGRVKMARTEDHKPLSFLLFPPGHLFLPDSISLFHSFPCSMEKTLLDIRRSVKENALAASTAAAAAMDEDDAGGEEEEEAPERLRRTSMTLAVVRGRVGGASGAVPYPICQVEKCSADLTEAKRYHRRHKVCEAHAKASAVIVGGLRQRFCQQCSRFHELSEFDEAKRSCRRRLAGHNQRRRKSSSEAHGEGSSSCLQAEQGGKLPPPPPPPISLPGNANYKHFQIR